MQNLSRRQFNTRAAATALLTISPALLLEGCSLTKAQLLAWAGDVDSAVAQIATALGADSLAAQLKADLATFDAAVNAWQGGNVVQDIISASKILEIGLGAVGLPTALVAVADIAINVLDTILANLPAASTAAPTAAFAVRALGVQAVSVRYTPRRAYKSRSAAVAAWNAQAPAAGLQPIKG